MWALIIPLVQAVSRHTLRGWGAILNLPPFYISVQQIQISHPRSVYSRVLTKLSLTAPPPYCSPHPDLHPGSVAQLKSAAQHLQLGFSLPLVHLGSAPSKPDHSPAHSLRLHCALDQPPCQRSNRERGAGHSTANLGEKKKRLQTGCGSAVRRATACDVTEARLHFPEFCVLPTDCGGGWKRTSRVSTGTSAHRQAALKVPVENWMRLNIS